MASRWTGGCLCGRCRYEFDRIHRRRTTVAAICAGGPWTDRLQSSFVRSSRISDGWRGRLLASLFTDRFAELLADLLHTTLPAMTGTNSTASRSATSTRRNASVLPVTTAPKPSQLGRTAVIKRRRKLLDGGMRDGARSAKGTCSLVRLTEESAIIRPRHMERSYVRPSDPSDGPHRLNFRRPGCYDPERAEERDRCVEGDCVAQNGPLGNAGRPHPTLASSTFSFQHPQGRRPYGRSRRGPPARHQRCDRRGAGVLPDGARAARW